MTPTKMIDLKEFVEEGFLQEVNRQFFHPLGLALSFIATDDGDIQFHGILDYRYDPEGMIFNNPSKEKAATIEKYKKTEERLKRFGWVIQPV